MKTTEVINTAFGRAKSIESKSLEEFLDGLLDEDLETLAHMPGTPGQVMASQFTYYVKSSITLSDALKRQAQTSGRLADTVLRLPSARSRRRKNQHTHKEGQ